MTTPSLKQAIANAIPARLVRHFAAPYVAGDSLAKAMETADRLYEGRGVKSTIDVLGEREDTREKVHHAMDLYDSILEALADRPYCTISVKPGQFGFYLDPDLALRNLERLAAAALSVDRGVTIDMEDTDLTDFTLHAYRKLKPTYPNLGTVLQSRLFRTPQDAASLDGLQAHIRACIGIYNVPPDKAVQKKREMKDRLIALMGQLFDGGHTVCVATHDIEYLAKTRALIAEKKIPRERYEFQMLLGVPRRKIQDKLVAAGETLRLYVPFAECWEDAVAYLRRRMAANPSMSSLVLKNLVQRG